MYKQRPWDGANQSILEEQSYVGDIPSKYWSSRTQCPWLQRSPCVRSWVVFLPIHCLLIKRILLPIFVLCFSHVYWLMNDFSYVINMHFILPMIYICMRYFLRNWLFAGEEKHPQKLWRRLKQENTKLRSLVINRVSQTLFLFSFNFL